MKLEDLEIYNKAMVIGEQVFQVTLGWDFFAKDTVGKQLVRSIDSVAANISEGFGRYHYKDRQRFNFYSRGSLYESKTWISKAHKRGLIDAKNYEEMITALNDLAVRLNNYISATAKQINK
jgi:four helix bundle protein